MAKEKEPVSLSRIIHDLDADLLGRVVSAKDDMLIVKGIITPSINEVVKIGVDQEGLILQFDRESCQVGVYTNGSVKVGDIVTPTGEIIKTKFSPAMLGHVIDFQGEVIDGTIEIEKVEYIPMERQAAPLIDREPVNKPMKTGILSIDGIIPIGCGQRELIIGDRETGKTQIAIDTIINQKGSNVICIYVAIGQKMVKVKNVYEQLVQNGMMKQSIIVSASPNYKAVAQYMAPYAATSIAEEYMNQGRDVLIVYDDLSKHAEVYRSISLLLENPPGREAYPGDVFYLHSRLLERSANLENGGSITALPIIETQEGDISAYIATNVIGITDGQIFTNSKMFKSNIKPAVDLGLSVSRVGSSAQTPNMKKLAKGLMKDYALYMDVKKNAISISDLSASMRSYYDRGVILETILCQQEGKVRSECEQLALLSAYQNNLLDKEIVHDYLSKVSQVFKETNSYLSLDEQDIIRMVESYNVQD